MRRGRYFLRTILAFAAVAFSLTVTAQEKSTVNTGAMTGIVVDSVHNYVLRSATISIYNNADSSLLGYSLSNNLGEFRFPVLPVGMRLNIVVSYVGYRNYSGVFIIPAESRQIDLGKLSLEKRRQDLDEVVVTARRPPVQMKGDTLEFNVEAFKLDSNAVVEDVLRRLPGITVWGDGTITVNGKKVNNVFVEGKPFFGGDSRIATQNIPKDAVDKIQVYQEKNGQNILDSITDINIKLKKNKKHGLFGKVGAGYGTAGHIEADAVVNIFSPKTQFSVVAAGNNINKMANNASMLIVNSSYKGIGANVEYQPDFRKEGSNYYGAGGLVFQHDFIGNSTSDNKNLLLGDYFVSRVDGDISKNSQTTILLGGDSGIVQNDKSTSNILGTDHQFNSKYEWIGDRRSFFISPTVHMSSNNYSTAGQRSLMNQNKLLLSTLDDADKTVERLKNISIEGGFIYHKKPDRKGIVPPKMEVSYRLNIKDKDNERVRMNLFRSWLDPLQNRSFDRKYDNRLTELGQHIKVKAGDVQKMFSGERLLGGISIELENSLSIGHFRENNKVYDFDTTKGFYTFNTHLTNDGKRISVKEAPALNLSKTFSKSLTNRYDKLVVIEASLREEFFNQQNVSGKSIRNFNRNYANLVPYGSIRYSNKQLGEFQTLYALSYHSYVNYPLIDQIAPLVDSADLYSIRMGNSRLGEEYQQEIAMEVQHNSLKARNPFNYVFFLSAGSIADKIIDSSLYDNVGRSIYYAINGGIQKYVNLGGTIKKAFKLAKDHQVQLTINSQSGFSRIPGYANSMYYLSKNFNVSGGLGIQYAFSDKVIVDMQQGLSAYTAEQTGFNSSFKSTSVSSNLSTSVKCSRRLSLSSNISYNLTESDGAPSINYTIWNAMATYRFLKNDNVEIKAAALDLLRQNTSVINYGMNNSLTIGKTNVLSQYFMVTVAWFPRRFGSK